MQPTFITNILVRLHEEGRANEASSNALRKQESEVLKVAKALRPKHNTVIPKALLENCSIHYQTHLERIGDYLLQGPGKWWDYVEEGVELYDAHAPHDLPHTPLLQHFRSMSMGDVDVYLLEKWEQCHESQIQLPALYIRTYTAEGDVNNIMSHPYGQTRSIHGPKQHPVVPPTVTLPPTTHHPPQNPAYTQ